VPMTFVKGEALDDDDEALGTLLDDVYSLGSARAVCLTPIRHGEEIVGVLYAEYDDPQDASRRASTQQELAHHVGPILDTAIRLHRRPLRRTSNALASLFDRPLPKLVKGALIGGAVAGVIWLLFFMQVPIYLRGDARLEPAGNLADTR